IKGIDEAFVNHLMLWANGIQGKFQRLILPAIEGKDYAQSFKQLSNSISEINRIRNGIVHTGRFADEEPAYEVIVKAKVVIVTLVRQYHELFDLEDIIKVDEKQIKSLELSASEL
ncbi:hypothetical protein, partial [Candidatus Enterovibrio escicola]|uniref:hypothetical protein n=1 Tax=Candidatus Enterovibrio escicola TaxID=1927127 RepID=UPI001CC2DDA0